MSNGDLYDEFVERVTANEAFPTIGANSAVRRELTIDLSGVQKISIRLKKPLPVVDVEVVCTAVYNNVQINSSFTEIPVSICSLGSTYNGLCIQVSSRGAPWMNGGIVELEIKYHY